MASVMKPDVVSVHLVPPFLEQPAPVGPPSGVFLSNGKPARRPHDTHAFCAGEYALWMSGAVVKRCVAAATQSGFAEVHVP